MKRKFTDAQAVQAIQNKNFNSIAKVVRSIGAKPSGSVYTLIQRIVKEYNLKTDHWFGQRWRAAGFYATKSTDDFFCLRKARISGAAILKTLLGRKLKKRECERCKLKTWMGESIPLEVHHIDGNSLNNFIWNLQVLCCNCHALTPNFGVKNRSIQFPLNHAGVNKWAYFNS